MTKREDYWTHLYNITREARITLGYTERKADRIAQQYADKWTAEVFDSTRIADGE